MFAWRSRGLCQIRWEFLARSQRLGNATHSGSCLSSLFGSMFLRQPVHVRTWPKDEFDGRKGLDGEQKFFQLSLMWSGMRENSASLSSLLATFLPG
jgi:hypothetical protein